MKSRRRVGAKQRATNRIIWFDDGDFIFPTALRKYREKARLTRAELGKMVGKEHYSIQRYESQANDQQFPKLEIFAKLCIALDVDPKKLLGLKGISAFINPESGAIYDWKLVDDDISNKDGLKFMWICSVCNSVNYEYDAYSKKKLKFIRKEFMCEYCNVIFSKMKEKNDG